MKNELLFAATAVLGSLALDQYKTAEDEADTASTHLALSVLGDVQGNICSEASSIIHDGHGNANLLCEASAPPKLNPTPGCTVDVNAVVDRANLWSITADCSVAPWDLN